jgi:hypothetical protein
MNKRDKRSLVVYVAGPYRSPSNWTIHCNIFRAEALAFKVWEAGMSALSPHLNTAHFQNSLPDNVWLEGDLEMLSRCDALLCAPGWEDSKGTLAEIEFARKRCIPIFYRLDDLVVWANAWEEASNG